MRRYLRRRFQDIGLRIGDPRWFTEGSIEALVRAASGQFVYVAVVFNYVSERRASPVHRLMTVLNWTPNEGQVARPFEALDTLYTNILLHAKEAYEAVDTHSGRDFLLLLKILLFENIRFFISTSVTVLGLGSNALEIFTSDLRSLMQLQRYWTGGTYIHVYHKSLLDFMSEENRSKELFVSQARSYTHLAKCCMLSILESPELDYGT
jgi:hypothetical protein